MDRKASLSLLCAVAVFAMLAVSCAGEEPPALPEQSGASSEAVSEEGLRWCEEGLTLCPGWGCVDLNTDRFNCGVCGGDCNYGGAHTVCEGGYCSYVD